MQNPSDTSGMGGSGVNITAPKDSDDGDALPEREAPAAAVVAAASRATATDSTINTGSDVEGSAKKRKRTLSNVSTPGTRKKAPENIMSPKKFSK